MLTPSQIDVSTPVLVWGGDDYCTLGIIRSLGRLGVAVHLFSDRPAVPASRSRFCAGASFSAPTGHGCGQELVDVLVERAAALGPRPILLPIGDPKALAVERFHDVIARYFIVPTPRPGATLSLYDKASLYRLCLQEDVPTPATVIPESVDEAMAAADSLRFPIVIKAIQPDQLQRRFGMRLTYAGDADELRRRLEALDLDRSRNLAIQEVIGSRTSDSWLLAAYFDAQSRCRFAITGQKLRQFPIDGGVTSLAVTAPCEPLVDSLGRLARAVGYHGFISADFRFDERDGTYKLLDVNPRPGANTRVFVDRCGLDSVRVMYLDLTGQPIPAVEPVWGRRWVAEDQDLSALREHMKRGTLSLGEWRRSLCGVREWAYWDRADIRPSITFVAARVWPALRRAFARLKRAVRLRASGGRIGQPRV